MRLQRFGFFLALVRLALAGLRSGLHSRQPQHAPSDSVYLGQVAPRRLTRPLARRHHAARAQVERRHRRVRRPAQLRQLPMIATTRSTHNCVLLGYCATARVCWLRSPVGMVRCGCVAQALENESVRCRMEWACLLASRNSQKHR